MINNEETKMNKIKQIKGILFDKDGTLLDFEATWRPVWNMTEEQLGSILQIGEKEMRVIRERLGILEDGFTSDSIYVAGTLLDYAQIISEVTKKQLSTVVDVLNTVYKDFVESKKLHIVPIGNPKEMMTYLKQKGYKLGIVTADNVLNTEYFIKETGIEALMDFIAADDGHYQMKPHPHMLEAFCEQMGLEKQEVAVVGDTLKDMKFGKNNQMGLSIYVTSSYPNTEAIQLADYAIDHVGYLIDIFE